MPAGSCGKFHYLPDSKIKVTDTISCPPDTDMQASEKNNKNRIYCNTVFKLFFYPVCSQRLVIFDPCFYKQTTLGHFLSSIVLHVKFNLTIFLFSFTLKTILGQKWLDVGEVWLHKGEVETYLAA